MNRSWLTLCALSAGPMASMAAAAAGMPCNQLSQLRLADTRITRAEGVAPSGSWPVPDSLFSRFPGTPHAAVTVPFCRVSALIDKEINVEVWLPLEWNQRYQGVGNGGFTGSLNYPAMASAVNAHFATASTDTGHATEQFECR